MDGPLGGPARGGTAGANGQRQEHIGGEECAGGRGLALLRAVEHGDGGERGQERGAGEEYRQLPPVAHMKKGSFTVLRITPHSGDYIDYKQHVQS